MDNFALGWQLGLEGLQEGGLKQVSGGPSLLNTPPPLIPSTSFDLLRIFPPQSFMPPFPFFADAGSPLWSVAQPSSTRHRSLALGGGYILDPTDLSPEVLRRNKLQFALMGSGSSLLIRQPGEVLDLLSGFMSL